jgi:hypothetical protein
MSRREWTSRAFGLRVAGAFDAPGLPPLTAPGDEPRTTVELVDRDAIEALVPAAPVERLLEERFPGDAAPARSIDRLPGIGYRLHARHFGIALVSEDGAQVRCAPPDDDPWSWQRFLVGRILPWAAVLRGREVFHAAAVSVGGRAIALVGSSGVGKSSLTARLVLAGAGFLGDDVLAIDGDDAVPRAHPGAGLVSVRDAERDVLGDDLLRLGRVLGASGGKSYVAVARDDEPRPLQAMYFLRATPGDEPAVAPLEHPDWRLLVGNTFVEGVRTPGRLRRQFELCAELAASVPLFRVDASRGAGAAGVAERLLEHASGALPAPAPAR